MRKAEFDAFAEEYRQLHAASVAGSGEPPEYFAEYKIRDLAHTLSARTSHPPARILDFGSGVAPSIAYLRQYFPAADLTCLDVSHESLKLGSRQHPEGVGFVAFDGSRIPFADGSFDCAFAGCVFHHIDHALHVPLLTEIRRVMTRGGLIMVYEHNPFNPLTVRAVRTCPFDANARLVRVGAMTRSLHQAGFTAASYRYRVFFPRALALLRPLENYLTWMPLGAQYFVTCRA